jgi:UDP-N-acetylmuramate--alanine ligase
MSEREELPKGTEIHMMAIGGVGMSGLALVMDRMGYNVSGCDLHPGEAAARLRAQGIDVAEGHDPSHLSGVGMVVASAAIPAANPELIAAREAGIPVLSRAEALGRLMDEKDGIAISGTHGKTTTTSMVASVLEAAGLDPTIIIGGDLEILGGNAKLGAGDLLVAEACEAYGSFLELFPRMAVILNIEHDHHDCYPTLEDVLRSFRQFLSQIKDGGLAIMCADCPNVRAVIPSVRQRVVTYGLSDGVDYRAVDVDADSPNPTFRALYRDKDLGEFTLNVPGEHNVRNALASIAVGSELGVDPSIMAEALADFHGAGRRFEVLGEVGGITVVDDYAHHPTEIRATIDAARAWHRRLVVVFQPHLYSRTESLAEEFAGALKGADIPVLTEIYAARERPKPGVSASMLVDMINSDGQGKVLFIPDKTRVAEELLPVLKPGDLVIVMGAGDIRKSGEDLLGLLEKK